MRVPKPIHFARSLAVALMVAVAVTAFTTAGPAAEGPALPPAEYKPLPEGTRIEYDKHIFEVTRSEGHETVFRVLAGGLKYWRPVYSLFAEHGGDLHVNFTDGSTIEYSIKGDGEKKLEAFWPLEVGKKVEFGLYEEGAWLTPDDNWYVTLKVEKTEFLTLNGIQYPTFVIEERGRSDMGKEYIGRKWYHPAAGLIIKAARTWTKTFDIPGTSGYMKAPFFNQGEIDQYSLVNVTFPEGTTTHALKGTKAGGASDKALVAEVQTLKQKAEEARKAQAASEKARLAELARLKQESEKVQQARQAEVARLKEEAEKAEQARAAEVKTLKQKAEAARKAEATRAAELVRLKKEAEKAEKARAAEVARLKQKAEEAWKAIEARQAQEAEAAKAREAEIARLRREAEEARKAVSAGADKARLAEIARLEKEVEQRHWDSVKDSPELAAVEDYLKRYPSGRFAAEAKARVAVLQRLASASRIDFGNYHALVIGIDDYKYLPNLEMAVKDAKAVAKVLKEDYGFKVTLLTDPNHGEIMDAFDELQETLTGNDNLLIYYAGHGWLNEEVDRGYWLPANAKPGRRRHWISNATITDTLKGLSAKHVMVVADSCYSGTLVRAADVGTRKRGGDYWKEMASKWARVAITSGGLEPVADKGGGENSPFAKAFIDTLKENRSVMDGTTLFTKMRRPVMVAADQTPQYSDVRGAGHDGGDFIFVRKK